MLQARYGLTVFLNRPDVDLNDSPAFVAIPFPALTLQNLAQGCKNPLQLIDNAGAFDPSAGMQLVVIFNRDLVDKIYHELLTLLQLSEQWGMTATGADVKRPGPQLK